MPDYQHTEAILEQFLQFAPDAIIGVDQSGAIVLANAQVEQVFGYHRDELLGEQIEILVPQKYRGDHLANRSRYFSDPRTRPMGIGLDLYGVRADGTEFPAEISLSSIDTEQGTIAIAAIRDVTERRRDEKKFEQLLEFAPDAIVGVDQSGLMVLANAQSERVFGYKRGEMLGQTIEMLVPERYRGDHMLHRAGYFRDPRTRAMGAGLELFGLKADGEEFPAEISLSSIQTDEGVIAVAAIRDISERVHAESVRQKLETELKLNQSRRMESVGQLAGGVAHDFNNLLSVIINYAQFTMDSLEDRPETRDDVRQIKEAATRAADLTRQLLIFSRRDVVKPEPINLNEVLSALGRLLQRTIGEQIELKTMFEPEVWTVIADPGQIDQVVINLAVNARDAMPAGGILHIETANVELDEEFMRINPDASKPGKYVRLSISDSGAGMDRETAERAFEPFFTTKSKAEGTGLGLATVYGIVKQAGGHVFLYTEPGRGTSFKVHLPAVDAPAKPLTPSSKSAPGGNGERVVVVEDEPAVRTMVKRILQANGYEVAQFSAGREALVVLVDLQQSVDLLLTDIVMPEISGQEIAEQVRVARPGLPILFMSGYSEAIIERHEAFRDITNLLEKPFTSEGLLTKVRTTLDVQAGA